MSSITRCTIPLCVHVCVRMQEIEPEELPGGAGDDGVVPSGPHVDAQVRMLVCCVCALLHVSYAPDMLGNLRGRQL